MLNVTLVNSSTLSHELGFICVALHRNSKCYIKQRASNHLSLSEIIIFFLKARP